MLLARLGVATFTLCLLVAGANAAGAEHYPGKPIRIVTSEAGGGNEHNSASEAAVVAKFERLAIRALPKAQVEELRDAMLGIEKLPAAARVGELLTLR